MTRPLDATLKSLVETSPGNWPVLLGQPPAAAQMIDADIATVSGAADKVIRVRGTPDWLLHLEFQSGPDSARLPWRLRLHGVLRRRSSVAWGKPVGLQ